MKNNRFTEIDDSEFIEEQLFETMQALFKETNVKRIKFLQNKINYLKQKLR
jgi:hypothetical protein